VLLILNHLSSAAFLLFFAHLLVFAAHSVEPIETKWRQSIEADLRNGDPEGDVCAKAKRRAVTSDNVAFKNWAYEIARRTCPSAGRASTAIQTIQSSAASTLPFALLSRRQKSRTRRTRKAGRRWLNDDLQRGEVSF